MINCDGLVKIYMSDEKISIKKMLQYEKTIMPPLNRLMTYKILPIYLIITVVILAAVGVLMEIDETKYLILSLVLLGVFCLMSVMLLFFVPFIRKRTIDNELKRYDFEIKDFDYKSEYLFSVSDKDVKFDINGIYINDELFYYNHMRNIIVTENYCHNIIIGIRFIINDEMYI